MTNFKGTKGKWVFDDEQIFSLNKEEDTPEVFIATNPEPYSETRETRWMYNALLISKAPEMLEMLENCFEMLDKLRPATEEEIREMKNNIKQLIKETTEI